MKYINKTALKKKICIFTGPKNNPLSQA